jgi:hypothetical protein
MKPLPSCYEGDVYIENIVFTRNSSQQRCRSALDCTLGTWAEHRPNYNVADLSRVDSSFVQNSLYVEV